MILLTLVLGSALLGQTADHAATPTIAPPGVPFQTPTAKLPAGLPKGTVPFSSDENRDSPPSAENRESPRRVPSTALNRLRLTPAELIAEALTVPQGGTLAGRPLSLVTIVSTIPERRQQFEAVHAYWRLVQGVAEYHFALDYDRNLGRLQARSDEVALLRTARAASAARIADAELETTTAQHDLAALMSLAPDSPLPLPADRPHVGSYRTYFVELFSIRPAPDRLRLIDRTLPLRSRAIDGYAAAVQAAEDALEAATESQASGEARLTTVLACMNDLLGQRRSLMLSVCRYNHDVAEYVENVVAPQATPDALVAMLIKQNREVAQPVPMVDPSGEALPASYQEPTAPPTPTPAKNWPTRAVRPGTVRPVDPSLQSPTPTEPSPGLPPRDQPTLAPPRELPSGLRSQQPTWVPPRPASGPSDASDSSDATQPGRLVPVQKGAADAEPSPHTVNKPILPVSALYPALSDMPAADRAIQLATALHWNRGVSKEAGRPIALDECLRTAPAADRRGLLAAYWSARQRAAQSQVLAQEAEALDGLATILADRGRNATAMLRLKTSQLATEAARIEAESDLVEARLELAHRAGQSSEPNGLLPSTVPFAGRYPLADKPSRGTTSSWPLRRLLATLPGLGESVVRRADTVVAADAARAAAVADLQAGHPWADETLDLVHGQTGQTAAFLQGLTDYNLAIADYCLATLPPGAAAERLASALMAR